jgi:hypothetical protein
MLKSPPDVNGERRRRTGDIPSPKVMDGIERRSRRKGQV